MELLYKLWKSEGLVDEWRTQNPWRVLCELYAKLLGLLLQHWLIVLFARSDPRRSLVKLAQVVRATGWLLMDALAGHRSVRSALQTIRRRMRGTCRHASSIPIASVPSHTMFHAAQRLTSPPLASASSVPRPTTSSRAPTVRTSGLTRLSPRSPRPDATSTDAGHTRAATPSPMRIRLRSRSNA